MKYIVAYRVDEIEAVVEAASEREAVQKFLAGEVEIVRVNFDRLWGDLVEVREYHIECYGDWEILY